MGGCWAAPPAEGSSLSLQLIHPERRLEIDCQSSSVYTGTWAGSLWGVTFSHTPPAKQQCPRGFWLQARPQTSPVVQTRGVKSRSVSSTERT